MPLIHFTPTPQLRQMLDSIGKSHYLPKRKVGLFFIGLHQFSPHDKKKPKFGMGV